MPRRVDRNACLSCGGCAGVCPSLAIRLEYGYRLVVDPERCTDCGLCTVFCPAGAIREA